jgi:hypothetical protein
MMASTVPFSEVWSCASKPRKENRIASAKVDVRPEAGQTQMDNIVSYEIHALHMHDARLILLGVHNCYAISVVVIIVACLGRSIVSARRSSICWVRSISTTHG